MQVRISSIIDEMQRSHFILPKFKLPLHYVPWIQSNDISIYDNEPFEKGGTRITCDRNTTFCDGVEGIFDANGQSNTNCVNVGQIGIPGQYPCPA